MTGYPGGSDLAFEDRIGTQFALTWVTGDRAEIAIDDDGSRWTGIVLNKDQIIRLAAHLIYGLSRNGLTVDRIIAALPEAA